jgi:O-antigen ligase/tetratricopeptide (TPR) repeat protein
VAKERLSPRSSSVFRPLRVAAGLLAGLVVACIHFPADSTDVESGKALYAAVVAIIAATIAVVFAPQPEQGARKQAFFKTRTFWLDALPWFIAIGMFLAALAMSSIGDWRKSTNEVWWWVTAASVWVAARRCVSDPGSRQAIIVLVGAIALSLSIQAMYQHFATIPQMWAQYQQDPESFLVSAGIDAPRGSAQRMIFENRLYDGGAAATFALANSLAAVLLVGGVLIFASWPRSSIDWSRRVPLFMAGALVLGGLLVTRSRSAIAAFFLALVAIIVWRYLWNVNQSAERSVIYRRFISRLGLTISGVIALVIVVVMFGRTEWVDAAPASMLTRFQYWRSCASMMADYPWTGAGPGNFQLMYEHYRASNASEQIADPHNFVIETFTSGGIIVGSMLLVWLVLVIRSAMPSQSHLKNARQESSDVKSEDANPHDANEAAWIYLGVVIGLIIAWLFRIVGGVADQWWVYAADTLAFVWALSWLKSQQFASERDLRSAAGLALSALLIHLCVAGGWTIPGIALLFWMLLGSIVGGDGARWLAIDQLPGRRTRAISVVVAGTALVGWIYQRSIMPVESEQRYMQLAAYSQSQNLLGRASQSIQDAVSADPYSSQAALWMCEIYRWEMVLGRTPEAIRPKWNQAASHALSCGGQSASLRRELIVQRLHVFQALGDPADLQAAYELLQQTVRFSPSGEWYWAQLSLVASELGDSEAAAKAARRARELSAAAGNIERDLSRHFLVVPQKLSLSPGQKVTEPVVRPASEALPVFPNT